MKNPVILLHGLDDTPQVLAKLARYLGDRGWSAHAPALVPSNGSVGLEVLAQQVADWVHSTFAPDQVLDLVGFSMGGIVGRYYGQRLGGLQRIQRFITLASPHNGTWMGYGRLNPGATQMRVNSPFLADLNGDLASLGQVQFTSLWTPLDLMIVPAQSSVLPVGRSRSIPVALHPWMVTDDRVLSQVAQLLEEES
ncbi:esterase/lipase family protein [Prochlorothrix hollandica]|uniref:Lipase class 2 n=1 Tax=Prochlorothrix hollandica PCC 9006 = CALU 1027 TaxID=317619 RepID=A0A0M2PWP6_PROHO|nr:alpha/beta fold hydrolase [Prochlorothrix hollandica]KKJ00841.1 lipase class 2 [Prochlorothrix hollandica PCC 9006 = CALU 1027]